MPLLKITDTENDGRELVTYEIHKRLDPAKALVAIIQALDALPELPKPRKPRSDAGQKRKEVMP